MIGHTKLWERSSQRIRLKRLTRWHESSVDRHPIIRHAHHIIVGSKDSFHHVAVSAGTEPRPDVAPLLRQVKLRARRRTPQLTVACAVNFIATVDQ